MNSLKCWISIFLLLLLAVLARSTPIFRAGNDIILYQDEPILLRPIGSEFQQLNMQLYSSPIVKAPVYKRNLVIGRGDLTFRPGKR